MDRTKRAVLELTLRAPLSELRWSVAMAPSSGIGADIGDPGRRHGVLLISRKRSSQVGRRQKKRPPRWTTLRFPVVFRSSSTLVVHSTRIHLGLAVDKPLTIRNTNMVAKRTFKSANKGKAVSRQLGYAETAIMELRFDVPQVLYSVQALPLRFIAREYTWA